MPVDRAYFDKLVIELDKGYALTIPDLGRIFGEPFWVLMVSMLLENKQPIIINTGEKKDV